MTQERTKPYQPSNSTEGAWFMTQFCDHCREQHPDIDTKDCDILCRSMAYNPTDEAYPREWVKDLDGTNPRCTAYKFHDWDTGSPEPIYPEPPNQVRIPLEHMDLEHNTINGNQTFDEYLGEARDRFVRKIREQEWNTPLRTEAENILIAYDQSRARLQNAANTLFELHHLLLNIGVTRGIPGAGALLQKLQEATGEPRKEEPA